MERRSNNRTSRLTATIRALSPWLVSGGLLTAAGSSADTIGVDSVTDDGSGCTLREAIANANSDSGGNGCAAGSGPDTIVFDSAVTGTITLTGGELIINSVLGINGPGQTQLAIDGNNSSRVFNIVGGAVTIDGLTISGGSALLGGGIENAGTLTLTNSTVSGNGAFFGGGIDNNDGTVILNNSTVSGNSAHSGGGIYNRGTLTLTNSTVSGNSAVYRGGGIVNNDGTMTLTNSTVSGNAAYIGGGIYNYYGIYNHYSGTLTLTNSTVSMNSADFGGGIYNSGTLTLSNSIIASSAVGGDCSNDMFFGTATAAFSLIESSGADACGIIHGTNNNIVGSDPNLGLLVDNGGLTQTHALLTGSPAIGAADHSVCQVLPVNGLDQRGVARDANCDIGAYEYGATPSVPLDHFLFYGMKLSKESAKLPKFGPVRLEDQFGVLRVDVSKGKRFGLPADKNSEGANDDITHLFEYPVELSKDESKFLPITDVRIDNQCGAFTVTVKKPRSLLLPTNKSLDPNGPPPQPDPADHNLDHFLCYDVKVQTKDANGDPLSKFPKGVQVEVSDQFQNRRYDLQKITKLCNPVDKSGEPVILSGKEKSDPFPITPATIRNRDDHLVCYQAKPAKKDIPQNGCGPADPSHKGTLIAPPQDKHAPVAAAIANQFEESAFDSKKAVELCIPSTKTLPAP